MPIKSRVIPLLAVLSVLASACGGGAGSARAPERDRAGGDFSSEQSSELAPDFTVTTFAGDTFILSEQRGTPVVLNFWESW